jgi:hypothetical protein
LPPTSPFVQGRRRLRIILIASLVTAAVALALVSSAAASGLPRSFATTSSSTFLRSDAVAFPNCALVSVDWKDASGAVIGFAMAGPEAAIAGSCAPIHTAAPSPPSECPPAVCLTGPSAGPSPIVYQTGTHGSFQFLADQSGYEFFEDQSPNSSNPSSDPVALNLSYTVPLVPEPFALPALFGATIVGVAAAVAAVYFLTRRRPEHTDPARPDAKHQEKAAR